MISRSISTNSRLVRVSSDAERVWTRILANADCQGCVTANLNDIRNEILPALVIGLGWSEEMIRGFIDELVTSELIEDHGEFFRVCRFDKHQVGLRKDKETPSSWMTPDQDGPAPSKTDLPGPAQSKTVHAFPREVEVKVEEKGKGKGKSAPPEAAEQSPPKKSTHHGKSAILAAWREAWESETNTPVTARGVDKQAAQECEEMQSFAVGVDLVGMFRRTIRELLKARADTGKNYPVSLRTVLNNANPYELPKVEKPKPKEEPMRPEWQDMTDYDEVIRGRRSAL
jgi:hypothetical protein